MINFFVRKQIIHLHQQTCWSYPKYFGAASPASRLSAIGEMFIRNKIIISGDAVATAHNIAASPLLWRIGITSDLIMHVCDLILAMVYYLLFKRVNKNLALLSVLFGLIQTAVLVANKLNLLMPIFLL